jgi:GTP-binding protein HflX
LKPYIDQARHGAVKPRALLVAVEHAAPRGGEPVTMGSEATLAELQQLTDTLGVETAASTLVRIREPQPRFLIGSGKADEIVAQAQAAGAELIVFDDPLSPSQQRNWEKLAKMPVIDRQEVILDIFKLHARTKEAVLQVELAKARYDLPRLRRRWLHFSRQRGMGGGMGGGRGEGEQQVELDARMIRNRIARLQELLAEVTKVRHNQRGLRKKKAVPTAAIVGYTNAGKSCLFNRLTDSGVLVQDKLFATLDPTMRRLPLPGKQELLLTDTVGFVRKLPHQLVEAFKSTLEVVTDADFLIEVLDVTSPEVETHHDTTWAVLSEIGASLLPVITVYNKTDLLVDPQAQQRLRRKNHDALFLSAQTGDGVPKLLERLAAQIAHTRRQVELHLPPERYDILALLHRTSQILELEYTGDGIRVSASVPPAVAGQLAEFEAQAAETSGE